MIWSSQQNDFLTWAETGRGSCVLEAVAGAGKTTTLVEAIERIPGSVAVLAYNKKIAEEIKARLVKKGIDYRKAEVGTVHSFGFRAYRKTFKDVQVDERKVRNICDAAFPAGHLLSTVSEAIQTLVGLAKQRAVGVDTPMNDMTEWGDIADHFGVFDQTDETPNISKSTIFEASAKILATSNQMTGIIDFNDMCYLPLVRRLNFWQFDVVMVDEAQDTNPARRLLAAALLKRRGRMIAVGDRHQAIYGFTGADNDSLDLIAAKFECRRMPLTVSYRCPRAVVEFARNWVDHIEAAETAPVGEVKSIKDTELVEAVRNDRTSAILCRNVKPLVSTALQLIRHKIPCRIEGRDISKTILKLAKRWKIRSLDKLLGKLDTYLDQQRARLLGSQQEAKFQIIEDTVETLRTIIEQCLSEKKTTLADVEKYVEDLFSDSIANTLVLSTIHKAKGREWPQVYWLDRANTCPSRYARQDWELEQETNLCYVAATRAQQTLIEVVVPERKR